ncbi:hypothetical protein BD779DRAFT_1475119 [Infundibulicybe gibba]|nr:hypothetical protein BD779DRAFT_1475119 [Infundibulicybe gibba]
MAAPRGTSIWEARHGIGALGQMEKVWRWTGVVPGRGRVWHSTCAAADGEGLGPDEVTVLGGDGLALDDVVTFDEDGLALGEEGLADKLVGLDSFLGYVFGKRDCLGIGIVDWRTKLFKLAIAPKNMKVECHFADIRMPPGVIGGVERDPSFPERPPLAVYGCEAPISDCMLGTPN